MARTLEQIISELNPTFQPQVQSLQERANLIPQQIQSEEAGLQAKQGEAFGSITDGARRRGLGFSGIPLGEQAKYTATEYLPALARLRQSGQERAYSLQDAILGINERRDTLGQQILGQERDRDFQTQQAELNRRAQAAAAAASAPTLGAMGGPKARVASNNNGGFTFYGADNKPITAAQYAGATGREIGDVLYEIGAAGDESAKQLYGQLKQAAGMGDAYYQKTLNYYKKILPHILGGV